MLTVHGSFGYSVSHLLSSFRPKLKVQLQLLKLPLSPSGQLLLVVLLARFCTIDSLLTK